MLISSENRTVASDSFTAAVSRSRTQASAWVSTTSGQRHSRSEMPLSQCYPPAHGVRLRAEHELFALCTLRSRTVTTMNDRLHEVYRRVAALPNPGTAQGSLDQFCHVLDQVEDEMSGVPKQTPPPPTGDGRMYCPLPDRTRYLSDGGIETTTTGHVVHVSADGAIMITNRRSGEVEFTR